MAAPTTLYHAKHSDQAVAQNLQGVLTNTYGLYLATHNFHWNVDGSKFVPLHALFEGQYNELFLAVDTLAERIRALGCYAMPFGGEDVIRISKATAEVLDMDGTADDRANRMVQNLIELNEAVVKSCQATKIAARGAHDDESENLIVERITVHQKALWMLESVLKA